jgi:hypothetical protein
MDGETIFMQVLYACLTHYPRIRRYRARQGNTASGWPRPLQQALQLPDMTPCRLPLFPGVRSPRRHVHRGTRLISAARGWRPHLSPPARPGRVHPAPVRREAAGGGAQGGGDGDLGRRGRRQWGGHAGRSRSRQLLSTAVTARSARGSGRDRCSRGTSARWEAGWQGRAAGFASRTCTLRSR